MAHKLCLNCHTPIASGTRCAQHEAEHGRKPYTGVAPRDVSGYAWSRMRDATLKADDYRCRACGLGRDEGVKLEMDHIVPRKWGGSHDRHNRQTLCVTCHRAKTQRESNER